MHAANTRFKISPEGLAMVKHFEGLFLRSYVCPGRVWTIGYGHTGLAHDDGTVRRNRVITEEEAEQFLRADLGQVGRDVKRLCNLPLKQYQFDALVSFQFNIGKLGSSTLRRRLNEGKDAEAAGQFARWVYAAGKRLPGLVRRRAAERAMFEGGKWRAWAK